MAISDTYLTYAGGAVKRTARNRKRWQNIWLLPSGTTTGSYIDNSVVATGSFQHTIDYLNSWREARKLDKKLHLKGPEKFTSRFDYGAPFYSRTVTNSLPPTLSVERRNSSGTLLDSWIGFAWPHPDARGLALSLAASTYEVPGTADIGCPDRDALFAVGSAMIAETLPSVPSISISQTIGELREGLPKIMSHQIANPSGSVISDTLGGAGDAYINHVFGIQPLIRDLQGYISTTKGYDDYNQRFHQQEMQLVRRSRSLGTIRSYSKQALSSATPTPSHGGGRHWFSGSRALITESTSDIWFSASYKIAPPKMDRNQYDSIMDWMLTYGVDPSPMTAWNLTPWTWLCDWVISFDDLINNISYLGRRGVSLHYAYVMAQTEQKLTWTYDGQYRPVYNSSVPGLGPTLPVSLTAEQTTVTKQRVKASPLGFGIVGKDLTDDQKGILTALGLTRFF